MSSKAERAVSLVRIKELIATVPHEYWASAIHKIECKRCKLDADMKEIEAAIISNLNITEEVRR